MNILNSIVSSIKNLSSFEKKLWSFSVISVTLSFLVTNNSNYLTLIASLIGVTALIFVAKGDALGQILIVVFSFIYAIISLEMKYYGEMITYLCMTMPISALSVISWIKNPYSEKEVEVSDLTYRKIIILIICTIITTWAFYYILKYFNTSSLFFSTISIATSFLAASLMLLRSPYYAIFYALNDTVLIVLWTIATISNISYFPMIVCFFIFLLNDIYGFISWINMSNRQKLDLTKNY